jgi:hypothetical protein
MPALQSIPDSLSLTATLDVDFLEATEGKGPPRFTMFANSGQVPMKVRGFFDPVVVDMAGAKFEKTKTPIIFDHDTTKRVGHTTSQTITKDGVKAEGVVSSSSDHAKQFVADSKAGFPFQVSIGASVDKGFYVPEGQSVLVNGTEFQGPIVVAQEVTIRELSIAVLGADSSTSATVTASVSPNKNQPTKKGRSIMPNLLSRLFNRGHESEGVDAETAVANERNRITQINAMLRPASGQSWGHVQSEVEQLRCAAIAGEVSLQDLPAYVAEVNELQAMRADRPNNIGMGSYGNGPAIHARNRSGNMDLALEAAVTSRNTLGIV